MRRPLTTLRATLTRTLKRTPRRSPGRSPGRSPDRSPGRSPFRSQGRSQGRWTGRTARPAVVAVTAVAALTASTLAYADGVDVSHWQGTVSWSKVKSDGITFAFMKATEGDYYTDPTWKTNWDGAQKQGIYRSAYHFARPSLGSAVTQAKYYVSRVGSFQDKGDLPPVLDLEATGNLSVAHLTTWVSTWLKTTEGLTGRTPIIYVSPAFWEYYLGNSTAFHHYPLWVANYGVSSPRVPGGWSTWTFWQRTSTGSVDGISGHVDLNSFNGSSAQLAKMANTDGGGSGTPPSGPSLPPGAATSLSLTPATTTPTVGQPLRFTGTLQTIKPVAPATHRPVGLWARKVGSSAWTKVGKSHTGDYGRYHLSVVPDGAADYQMHWSGGDRWAASLSPVVRVSPTTAVVPSVDLAKDQDTVHYGAPLMLYGHVTSAGDGVSGVTVSYYKRMPSGGDWVLVGTCTSVAPTGWHSLVVHPKIARVWKVVTTPTDHYQAATSSYLSVNPVR